MRPCCRAPALSLLDLHPSVTVKPKLLLLTHRAPYPPDRGDRIRSYHLLRYLSQQYDVFLGATNDEPVSAETTAALADLTADLAICPVGHSRWVSAAWTLATGRSATEGLFASSPLTRRVRTWACEHRFEAVISFCSSMVQFTMVPELAGIPLVVDLVDVDSQKWLDYAAAARGLRRQLFLLEGRRVRKLEQAIVRRANAITLVSQAEAELFRRACPNDKTFSVPNGVDLEYFNDKFPVAEPKPNQCVFVGVLDYRANVESLVWFCREVWPLVIAKKPDAVFAIVGKNPAPAVKQLASQPGIRLVGPVTDVRPYVAESRFSVAPLQIARGIQNKVLEAMAMGKPVLATPQALEGLSLHPALDARSASTADEWSVAMLQLYSQDDLAGELGDRGLGYVRRAHSWPACLATVLPLLAGRACDAPRQMASPPSEPVAACLSA
jgi:polysaccharide biosynthesis protein PslH